jgi:hypothetical protein
MQSIIRKRVNFLNVELLLALAATLNKSHISSIPCINVYYAHNKYELLLYKSLLPI